MNSGNIDILSKSPFLYNHKPYTVHLSLCADGFSNKK